VAFSRFCFTWQKEKEKEALSVSLSTVACSVLIILQFVKDKTSLSFKQQPHLPISLKIPSDRVSVCVREGERDEAFDFGSFANHFDPSRMSSFPC
jgi:hypothetical protein